MGKPPWPLPHPAGNHPRTTKAVVALLLTFAAGCVDIIGYLTLSQFTAHMTGNTVHLAQNAAQAHWIEAAKAGVLVAAFLVGSVLGRTVIEIGSRIHVRKIASFTLLIQACMLAAVIPLIGSRAVVDTSSILIVLVMLATAMGMQTATLTRIGSLTVHTTFVTGMLNKLAQLLSHGLFLTYDISRRRPVSAERQMVFRRTSFIFSIWCLYLIGAAVGTCTKSWWGNRALLLPISLILSAIAVDQVVPLAIEEEHDEPER